MKITVPRYLAIVAIIYLVATAVMLYWGGEIEGKSGLNLIIEKWQFLLGGMALGPMGTLAMMGRMEDAGGSIYFSPTVMHCFFLMLASVGYAFHRA